MTDNPDLWDVRTQPDGLTLELQAGKAAALIQVQSENRARVQLIHVKGLVVALTDAAADLAEVLAAAGDHLHVGWPPGGGIDQGEVKAQSRFEVETLKWRVVR